MHKFQLKFVPLALCLAGLGMVTMQAQAVVGQCTKEATAFVKGQHWDAQYDVVVVGFGFAGGAASIAAADKGAHVLLLEKAKEGEEGGNSKYSAQHAMWIDGSKANDDRILSYFQALRGEHDNPSDATYKAFIKEVKKQVDYLKFLGAADPKPVHYAEYPDLPGAEAIYWVAVNLPGGDSAIYKLVHQNIEKRHANVDVLYNSPAVKLIQDPCTHAIVGVEANVHGKLTKIYANNGVVLATGGFENNQQMFLQYGWQKGFSKGAHFNTGDGIHMAQAVGARIVNMATLNGPDPNVLNPQTGTSFGYMITGTHDSKWAGPAFANRDVIFVGADGQRFTNEAFKTKHGRIKYHGDYRQGRMPDPAFMIFDEDARKDSKVYSTWDQSLEKEMKEGLVVKADTLEDLAKKLGISPEGLLEQVKAYNGYAKDGVDPMFHREKAFLHPIDTAPFYGVKLSPTFTNTQGGPQRNENAQLLDVNLKPIPHLYGAGELGSIFSDKYNGSGNIGESLVFGRIAGWHASAAKKDLPTFKLAGHFKLKPATDPNLAKLKPGEKLGIGHGIGGRLALAVGFDKAHHITSVRVLESHETQGIGSVALEKLPQEAVKNNGVVDTVSGASVTSKAFKAAIADAMSK